MVALMFALLLPSGCSKPGAPSSPAIEDSNVSEYSTSLSQRLELLEAREAVQRLQRAYGFYTSRGDWSAVAALFASDGVYSRGDAHIIGPDAILEHLQSQPLIGNGIDDGVLAEEYQLQPVIQLAADGLSAQGRWRSWIMRGQQGVDAYWGDGIYTVDYRLVDGVWRIARLHWDETFIVPYQGGWAANASINAATAGTAVWPHRVRVDYRYSPQEIARVSPQAPESDYDDWRLHYLEDAAAIEDLLSAYGYYLSDSDFRSAASLYASDGRAEIGQRGVFIGQERIAELLAVEAPFGSGDGVLNNHIQIQAVIHVAPDRSRAWSRSRTIMQLGKYQVSGAWGDAVVENEYVLEDNRWRIASHKFYPTFISDYDKGYAGGAVQLAGPGDEFPPDLPPTEVYQSFPDVYTPPFHYVHPVTGQPFDDRPAAVTYVGTVQPPVAPALGELSERISVLEDVREVTNLQRSYGFIVDKALWKNTSELFAHDGTLEIGGRGVFVSTERVHEYYGFLGAEGPEYGRLINHIQMQPLVTVDAGGQSARLHSHFLAQGGDIKGDETVVTEGQGVQTISYLGTGWYDNRYRKENGVWKIETLHGLFRMYTFEDKGWGVMSLPNTKLEERMQPDRPPTQVYQIFPKTFFPTEHFRHPVTGARRNTHDQ